MHTPRMRAISHRILQVKRGNKKDDDNDDDIVQYIVSSKPVSNKARYRWRTTRACFQLKSGKMLHKCSKDCTWKGLRRANDLQYCDKPVKDSMFVSPVEPVELQYLVNGLRKNKSPGFDNIGPSLVKLIFPVICHLLTLIYNLSLCSGQVPKKFNIAKVIPV